MFQRGWGFLAAVLVIFAGLVRAGPAASPKGEKKIADFEAEGSADALQCYGGDVARVKDDSGWALKWTLAGGDDSAVNFESVPADLRPYRVLRFRVRLDGASPGKIGVLFGSSREDYEFAEVGRVDSKWRTVSIPLATMRPVGSFDAQKVSELAFVVFRANKGTILLDDVTLCTAAPEVSRTMSTGPDFVVADFEDGASGALPDAYQSSAKRVADKSGHAGEWTIPAGKDESYVEFSHVPSDITAYRTLRFRIRTDRSASQPVCVRLEDPDRSDIGTTIQQVDSSWRTVEISLPKMAESGHFAPGTICDLAFIVFDPKPAKVLLDDVVLVKGKGGWRYTPKEEFAYLFGKRRADRVKQRDTRHFRIFTDSRAALGKFPEGLEKIYDFVKGRLDVPDFKTKLPVYIFENAHLYVQFCVRTVGWTRQEAENTGGHGSARYFATYYQSPEAAVVAHELTHSIFQRTWGAYGGSWFQEGPAVYIEHLWQHQSVAELFAPQLRNGHFMPLAKFMAIPVLVQENDVRGGAGTAGSLYEQAGALFEFLYRGPLADRWKKAFPALATTAEQDDAVPARLASLMGMSISDLQKKWVAWGSHPPRAK